MKKLPVLLILAAVAAAGCTSTASSAGSDVKTGEKALSEATESDTYTVKHTDSGFTPKRLVIREGDKVRWIDSSGDGVELTFPQSGDCESNSSVKNSCEALEKYSYSFEDQGTYNYYTEANRVHRGMITVNKRVIK
jgi:plastocyanin